MADVELIFKNRLVLLVLFTRLSIDPVLKEFKLSKFDKRSVFEVAIKKLFKIIFKIILIKIYNNWKWMNNNI